jgi:hypothetical protein
MPANRQKQGQPQKANATSFKPGQSGNPSGRPKDVGEVIELARKHTTTAIERLVYWMNHENPKASVAATQAILDRGWGKPVQPNEISGKDGAALVPAIAVTINRD